MSTNEEKPSCERCRFWDRTSSNGNCHRFPPTVNPPTTEQMSVIDRVRPLQGYQLEAFTHYPQTKSYDWCGEFKAQE